MINRPIEQRQNLIKDIEKHLKENYTNLESAKVNGLLVLYNNMLDSLFDSQIKSLGFVIILIFLMFLILFKSFNEKKFLINKFSSFIKFKF